MKCNSRENFVNLPFINIIIKDLPVMYLSVKQKEQFYDDGFVVIRNLFSKEEIAKLSNKAHNDR